MRFAVHLFVLGSLLLWGTVYSQTDDYLSYIGTCDSTSPTVIFTNFKDTNCAVSPENYSFPLGVCVIQGPPWYGSWNAFCNNGAVWFNNFDGNTTKDMCMGTSTMTRAYWTGSCVKCENSPQGWCVNP